MKQIKLPAGAQFRLKNTQSRQVVSAPKAFTGRDWRVWPKCPKGIEYEVTKDQLPENWDYTVGPDCRIIKWDPEIWGVAPPMSEEAWGIIENI